MTTAFVDLGTGEKKTMQTKSSRNPQVFGKIQRVTLLRVRQGRATSERKTTREEMTAKELGTEQLRSTYKAERHLS